MVIGITPIDQRIMVLPDPVEEVTKGGILLPDQTKEADRWATTRGTLMATGACAWSEAMRERPNFVPPSIGARIVFGKYANHAKIKGNDGVEYWIMNDADVVAVLENG